MKVIKGEAGYISSRKKQVILKAVLEFGIVIALLVLGIVETGDRLNLLTLVAVLGCLPASKALVEVIMICRHRSISKEKAEEIAGKTELLTVAYDMVFTSEKAIMPVESIVISDNTICGYTSNKKVDTVFAAKHIKQILHANQFTKVSVKIFDNYTAFLTRAEGMNNIEAIEKTDTRKKEEAIKKIILNISL
ncbi:MAG: hypothetical protein IJZ53_10175 [Tyzzerella sp.]|nr:hypothetical protein [Tyzzerella sp.]